MVSVFDRLHQEHLEPLLKETEPPGEENQLGGGVEMRGRPSWTVLLILSVQV